MTRRQAVALAVAAAVAAALAIWLLAPGDSGPRRDPAAVTSRDAGSFAVDRARTRLPPHRRAHAPRRDAPRDPGARRPLVGLFDTDALCEQHNAEHCAALRAATERCDRDDLDGCRAALALVDRGALRDISLAFVFARRLCEAGRDCARLRTLEDFRAARTDPAAYARTHRACDDDAVACAYAALATEDEAEARLLAMRACEGGVIALGGCIDASLLGDPDHKQRALARGCDAGSADACYLLGRLEQEAGEHEAARAALTRACELAPGGDACNALIEHE